MLFSFCLIKHYTIKVKAREVGPNHIDSFFYYFSIQVVVNFLHYSMCIVLGDTQYVL